MTHPRAQYTVSNAICTFCGLNPHNTSTAGYLGRGWSKVYFHILTHKHSHGSPAGYSSRRYSTNQTTYSCPGPGSMF